MLNIRSYFVLLMFVLFNKATRVNVASKSKALAAISSGLGKFQNVPDICTHFVYFTKYYKIGTAINVNST